MAKYVSWSEPNWTPMGHSEETSWASLSIQHPISKRGHSWRMEKDRSGKMSPTCFIPCLENLVLSLKIMEAIQSTRFSSFCCGVYSFLHHPNLSKTEKCVIEVILLTLLSCYKLNRCYIKLSLVNILEMVFVFIEILLKFYFSKGVYSFTLSTVYINICVHFLFIQAYSKPKSWIFIVLK